MCNARMLDAPKLLLLYTIRIHYTSFLSGVELTWNYGSENEDGMVYNTGNADATGTADGSKIRGGD